MHITATSPQLVHKIVLFLWFQENLYLHSLYILHYYILFQIQMQNVLCWIILDICTVQIFIDISSSIIIFIVYWAMILLDGV